MIIDFGDGLVTEHLLAHGVYLLDVFDRENGQALADTRYVTAYDVSVDAMPRPEAGTEWVANVTIGESTGTFAEVQTHNWGAATQITLSGCTYDVIPSTIRYDNDDEWFIEDISYLPQVGIGLLTAYTDGVDGRYEYPKLASLVALGN
ncbi:MAG: hypothetical protein AAFU41_18435 [Pseudomonadota bacterium]